MRSGGLPAEDSVALERLVAEKPGGRVKIAVPVTGRIANFDDLDPLRAEPQVELVFVRKGGKMPADAALVVLPGSKSTIADMAELRANGWEGEIIAHHRRGGAIIGICGGYQMLGRTIADPHGIEGDTREIAGMGLLDIETVMEGAKIVRNSSAVLAANGLPLQGYEIHMGRTTGADCERPMVLIDGRADGAVSADGSVMGCYLHGLFGADAWRAQLLASLGAESGGISHRAMVEDALDELARNIEQCLDVEALLATAAPVQIQSK